MEPRTANESRLRDSGEDRLCGQSMRGVAAATVLAAAGVALSASSHREAPGITKTPKLDGTDFYMFRSYEPGRDEYVTLLANYIAARRRLRRAQLLHARRRGLRDPRRQQRRRARGHHVPVPVPEDAEKPGRAGRRQDDGRAAHQHRSDRPRPGDTADLNVLETYTLRSSAAAAAPGQRARPSPTRPAAARPSRSRWIGSATSRSAQQRGSVYNQ